MSLALIRYEESDGQNRRFWIDLGRNRYYAFAIGNGERVGRNGVPMLDNPSTNTNGSATQRLVDCE